MTVKFSFKEHIEVTHPVFFLAENQQHLGQKIGDALNGLNTLNGNTQGMGQRQIVKNSEQVVNQIRRILHTHWPKSEEKHLERLQKAAYNISKAIEEKGDLDNINQSAATELQQVMGDLGVPMNNLGTPDKIEQPKQAPGQTPGIGDSQGESPPEQPPQSPPQAPEGQQGQQPGGMPDQMAAAPGGAPSPGTMPMTPPALG